MQIKKTNLPGVTVIYPNVYEDERGYFFESFQKYRYHEVGVTSQFVQDNHSHSTFGVLRGLHFQKNKPQGKLVSCTRGSVFDVVVDVVLQSPTFGMHFSIELSEQNHTQLWIPPGYAHGFCVTSDTADFHYKCTEYYDPKDEDGLVWNDPELGIEWPIKNPIVSSKDQNLPSIENYKASCEK